MKKAISLFLCFVLLSGVFTVDVIALGTSAQAHILMDADSGIILSENNKDMRLKMASTTKILTTLITLEAAEKKDDVVTFTEEMTAEGSSMNLQVGDKVHLSDLAKGMMMSSGNDAANAAALSISKSFEGFATLMNVKAKQIGMKNSNFVTPSGLDDDEHYSTAYDMALLMAYAVKNESFSKLSASTEQGVDFIYPEGKTSVYTNHNKLLSTYKYCTGGKTGYTKAAGRCLVTTASKDGATLVAVTLNAPNDWADHKALFEYGFSLYTQFTPEETQVFNIAVSGGEVEFVSAKVRDIPALSVPAQQIKDIKKNIYLPTFVFAPVNAGDTVGKIIYTLNGKELGSAYIKADVAVRPKARRRTFAEFMKAIF